MFRHGVTLTTDMVGLAHYARAATLTYLTIAYCQFVNILSRRQARTTLFHRNLFSNRIILISIVVSIGLIFLGICAPGISGFLSFACPQAGDWVYILGAAAVYLLVFEVMKLIKRRRHRSKQVETTGQGEEKPNR